MQDMALHTSSVVDCSIPSFSLAVQCRVVRNTQASVYHQSERNLQNMDIAEFRHKITHKTALTCYDISEYI